MIGFAKFTGWGPVLAIVALALGSAPASAQRNPYNLAAPVLASPYYGYFSDPYGLFGAADILRAHGELMVNQQEAYIKREHARQERIVTKRKGLEQWLWERENLPTPEDERQRNLEEYYRHSLLDPPLSDIWSGVAMNHLLDTAQRIHSPGVESGNAPVKPEVLAKINLTVKSGGNIGILKDGKLPWPLLLKRKFFEKDRQEIDRLTAQAIQQVALRSVDPDILESLHLRVTAMDQSLTATAKENSGTSVWNPLMFFDARNFLDQFRDALKILAQNDAGNYFNGNYSLQGKKTVAEVVDYMTQNGLRFAPATPGSEAAYVALHRLLAAYDTEGGPKPRKPR